MKKLLTALCLLSQCCFGQYNLGFHLEKGQGYGLHFSGSLFGSTEMDGKKMSVQGTMEGIAHYKVTEATDQQYVLEASYDTLNMTMVSAMGRSQYSYGPSLEPAGSTKPHLLITLLTNGTIKKIVSSDTTKGPSMMRNFPMMDNLRRMMMMMGQMGNMGQMGKMGMGGPGGMMNHKAMHARMEKLLAIYPDKPVGLHEHWGARFDADSTMPQEVSTDFELLSYGGGMASIRGKALSKTVPNLHKPMGMMSMMGTPDISTEAVSDFQVDTKTGWIRRGSFKFDLLGKMEMKDPSGTSKNLPLQLTAQAQVTAL